MYNVRQPERREKTVSLNKLCGVKSMRFVKCPRCELNYIKEDEQYCSVCLREMNGEIHDEPYELCSICNENPCMPGKDVCYACYKEMTQQQNLGDSSEDDEEDRDVEIDMEEVSEMEEIDLGEIPDDVPNEMVSEQLSLEEEQQKEADEDDNLEDEEM